MTEPVTKKSPTPQIGTDVNNVLVDKILFRLQQIDESKKLLIKGEKVLGIFKTSGFTTYHIVITDYRIFSVKDLKSYGNVVFADELTVKDIQSFTIQAIKGLFNQISYELEVEKNGKKFKYAKFKSADADSIAKLIEKIEPSENMTSLIEAQKQFAAEEKAERNRIAEIIYGERLAAMVHLGKGVDDKTFKKIDNYLMQLLDNDEKVMAVINATRFSSPAINGLVLTNHRILLAKKPFAVKIDFLDEIAADDILEFTSDKGLLKAMKLYVTKKDGTKVFLGSSYKEDVEVVSSLLPKMSGAPNPITEKIIAVKNAEIVAKKQAEVEKEKDKEKEKEANKLLQEKGKKAKQILKEKDAKQEQKSARLVALMACVRDHEYILGKYIVKSQINYILQRLDLPKDEEVLGVYESGGKQVYITSIRLILINDFTIKAEVSGNNIADVVSGFLGVTIKLHKTQNGRKKLRFVVWPEESADIVILLNSIKLASAPMSSIMNKDLGTKKDARLVAAKARGNEIGHAYLTYNGGLGNKYDTNKCAMLECFENEVVFTHRKAPIAIPANQITGFEISGQKHTSTNSRLSVTRMATLGVFSLAAPKRSTVTQKESFVNITLKNGSKLFFYSPSKSPDETHRTLSNAISHYSSLLSTQDSLQHTQPLAISSAASEIASFAELHKQGIITDSEFEAKKKQLLGL